MNDYFIINLPLTREAEQVMFWGCNEPDTGDYRTALIVTEEYVNSNLNRYDNGRTTRAILCRAVRNHQGNLMELLEPKKPTTEEGEAA